MAEIIYKDIKGFETLYQAGNDGTIKALEKVRFIGTTLNIRTYHEKILSPSNASKSGYLTVTLLKCGYKFYRSVHGLIAETFIDNPNNLPCVNHKDGNKLNNNSDNLEWCTHSQNSKHNYKIGIESSSSFTNKNNPSSIKIIDTTNDKIYNCIKDAWKENSSYSYDYFLILFKKGKTRFKKYE